MPQVQIDFTFLNIPITLTLADPTFYKPSQIDLLLGADIYYDNISNGLISLGKNLPTLQNTHLGWILDSCRKYQQ